MNKLTKVLAIVLSVFGAFLVISPIMMILYITSYDPAGQFANWSWWPGIGLCALAVIAVLGIPAIKGWDWSALSKIKWRWFWVPLTAIALAVISTIFVSRTWYGLPGMYILYWLFFFWIVTVSLPIYIISQRYYNAVNSAVGWVIGQLWTNNNARFWLLAIVFANFTLLAILYGPPTTHLESFVRSEGFTLKPVGTQAEKLVNIVTSNKTLNDIGNFILFGKESSASTSATLIETPATTKNQDSQKPIVEKGLGLIIFAMFFGFLTIVYLPFAFADEVFAWIKKQISRRKKEVETETEEAMPIEGALSPRKKGWLKTFFGFSLVDFFWETFYWIFGKITKSA